MVFTTQLFTFAFLPILILTYYPLYFLQGKLRFLQKVRATDLLIIALSLVFYMWSCFDNVFPFLAYILIVYFMGLTIQYSQKRKTGILISQSEEGKTKVFPIALLLTLSFCAVVVFILVHFKYLGIVAQLWNFLFIDKITPKTIIAPLGISFITFSAISYIVDIYKGKAQAGSFIDCVLYMSFFAKVVSGPIVLWRDFKNQKPSVSLSRVSEGVIRVMIGFAKKAILADSFGLAVSNAAYALDVPSAWGMAILYMLQIYYDFSGYSDIALGLSKMLGFEFEENFNFPYLSTSITEFWRRWHISLGRWFREYVYFPLGGSKCGKKRTVINIAVVFVLTGIWHGAGWTYMLWGIANGVCNIIEKLISNFKIYEKTPKFIKWLFTMGVTLFCWQLFRASGIKTAGRWIFSMFGLMDYDSITYTWKYYFDTQMIVFAVIGMLFATVFGLPKVQTLYKRVLETKVGYVANLAVTLVLFILAILFMVNSTYSPFLYFQY